MIELNLNKTWVEISDYLDSYQSNPLRVAELVNRVSPCCWTFKFSFDNVGINLEIECDSDISDIIAQNLINGMLEESLFSDYLFLRQSGVFYKGDTSQYLKDRPPTNTFTLQNTDQKANSLLTLNRFWCTDSTPPEIQQDLSFSAYFLENTWLGSHEYVGSKHKIDWIVFGTEYTIYPDSRYKDKLGSKDDIYSEQVSLYDLNGVHIGHATFLTSPSLKKNEIYTTFGPINPMHMDLLNWGRKDCNWIVEIGARRLNQHTINAEFTTNLINELVYTIQGAMISVMNSTDFLDYKYSLKRRQLTEAAQKLKERQNVVQSVEKVYYKDDLVMVVPSNENQVLVLLAKLEGLDALPFHDFCLMEYTSQEGIDALASWRISSTSSLNLFSPIELEFQYENFLTHEHPHQQVDLVICWGFRDQKTAIKLHKHKKWLFEYRNDESYYILLLSQIPNLDTKGN